MNVHNEDYGQHSNDEKCIDSLNAAIILSFLAVQLWLKIGS